MHILFTNNTLSPLAGTELYVYDLASEMRRRGHKVTCFSLLLGEVAERLQAAGVTVTSDLASVDEDVDIIHAHHCLEMRLAAARFPLVPLVYVSHGVTHPLENPGRARACATRYVAISEEVRLFLISREGIPDVLIEVIPNFVDTSRFVCRAPISERPRRVLVLSNHFGDGATKQVIEQACKTPAELELRVIGSTTRSVWNVEDYIEWADVVITLGRGALQAMAMGRAVVVYDYRGGDGLITLDNFDELAAANFSGRAYNIQFTPEQLAEEIVRYDRAQVEDMMGIVRETRSLPAIADRLLAAYDRAAGDYAQTWPEERRVDKLKATLREVGEYAIQFKAADNYLAETARLRKLCEERDNEIRKLRREVEVASLTIRRLESELSGLQEHLRHVAAGRTMRVLNGISRLVGRL